MRHLILLSAGAASLASFQSLAAQPRTATPPAASPPGVNGSAQGDVSVTIYNNDLALVQDTRQLAIPAGRSRLEFPDVSAQIRAETVSFAAPDAGIVEQNFDYDLLSPGKLMEKAVGGPTLLSRDAVRLARELRRQSLGRRPHPRSLRLADPRQRQ